MSERMDDMAAAVIGYVVTTNWYMSLILIICTRFRGWLTRRTRVAPRRAKRGGNRPPGVITPRAKRKEITCSTPGVGLWNRQYERAIGGSHLQMRCYGVAAFRLYQSHDNWPKNSPPRRAVWTLYFLYIPMYIYIPILQRLKFLPRPRESPGLEPAGVKSPEWGVEEHDRLYLRRRGEVQKFQQGWRRMGTCIVSSYPYTVEYIPTVYSLCLYRLVLLRQRL